MNFRNISSWCIRNPVAPIVLFVGLMLAGLVTFAGMQVNNVPDIDFPAVDGGGVAARCGAQRDGNAGHPADRIRDARGERGRRDQQLRQRRQQRTNITFQIGVPTDRAVNDVRNAVAQIRSNLPDGILEPQVTRVDYCGRPDPLRRRPDHRHDAGGAELVHRQYRRQAAAGGRWRRRGQPHRRSRPRRSA